MTGGFCVSLFQALLAPISAVATAIPSSTALSTPLERFKALEGMRGIQMFNIHKSFGSNATLPSAHTCFNQLDLPQYETEEQCRERLLYAIKEGYEGFGFG